MKTFIFIMFMLASPFLSLLYGQQIQQINSQKAAELIKSDKNIVILDVRTAQEFQDGHIKSARNLDMKQADFQNKISNLDRNARYVVHCRTSNRSMVAANWMLQKGFKNIYVISDGFTGWKANGLPVE